MGKILGYNVHDDMSIYTMTSTFVHFHILFILVDDVDNYKVIKVSKVTHAKDKCKHYSL